MLAERIDEFVGEAFNFGAGESIRMLDLVKLIIRAAGKENRLEPEIMLQHKIEGEIDAQYLSAEKARQALGWRAEISFEDGIRRSIDWYRQRLNDLSWT